MTEERPKGPEWVIEQLEKIAEAMLPTDTCVNCKECPTEAFENCMKGMGLAISELAGMMVYVIQHINVLYDVMGNMTMDPEKFEEMKKKMREFKNGKYESYYS